jgi:hypothetical protein
MPRHLYRCDGHQFFQADKGGDITDDNAKTDATDSGGEAPAEASGGGGAAGTAVATPKTPTPGVAAPPPRPLVCQPCGGDDGAVVVVVSCWVRLAEVDWEYDTDRARDCERGGVGGATDRVSPTTTHHPRRAV